MLTQDVLSRTYQRHLLAVGDLGTLILAEDEHGNVPEARIEDGG